MTTPAEPGPGLERLLEEVEVDQYLDFYEALPSPVAQELGIALHRSGRRLRFTATGFDHPMFNRVMGVGLDDGPDPDGVGGAAVDRAAKHYGSLGVRRWMVQLLPHLQGPGFEDRVRPRGVVRLRGWTKHLGPASLRITATTELRLCALDEVEIVGEKGEGPEEVWAGIVIRNFGLPEAFAPWLAALGRRDRWRLYLALDGPTPVATAALFLCDSPAGRFGQLTFGSTLPDHRGRGAQSALVARRIHDARALGAEWIVSETDEDLPDRPNPSYRNLVRLGLPAVYVRGNWGPPKPSE